MNASVRLIVRDFWARGGWILFVLFVLQFFFALHFLGFYIRDAEVALVVIMGLSLLPMRAPSYRLLTSLPLSRRAIDLADWLFSGGLPAVTCTCANLVALAICWLGSMETVDGWRVTLLMMGAPGLIGLFVVSISLLLRYSGVGASRTNRDRPYLLPTFLAPMFLVFVDGRGGQDNPLLESSGLAAFAIGCLALAFLKLSPDKYRRWINTPSRPSPRSTATWMFTSKWRLLAFTALLGGLPSGMLIGFVFCSPNGPFVKLLLVALMSVNGLIFVRTIKVLRSLPWSIHSCTTFVFAGLLSPPFVALLSTFGTGAWRGCAGHTFEYFQFAILPLLAISAIVSVLITRLILRDRFRPYYAVAIMLGAAIAIVDNADRLHGLYRTIYGEYAAAAQLLAALTLATTYIWLLHEIRTNAILYHYQPSGTSSFAAS